MEVSKKQISDHVHAIRIPFQVPLGPGRFLERFVYVFLVYEDSILLVNAGVSGSTDIVLDYVRETGRDPSEISTLVLTHAHPDHVGGALSVQRATGCKVAAHRDDVRWIEDVAVQNKERPVPGFHTLVEGSVKVDRVLEDGDRLELSSGSALEIIHTPGHSRGHIALFHRNDGVMIAGDCVPVPGDLPVYDDVAASLTSIEKVSRTNQIGVLLSSWDEPRHGPEAAKSLQKGAEYIEKIHQEVVRQKTVLGAIDVRAIATGVCHDLGLPETTLNPVFFRTIEAHLRAKNI